MLAVDSPVVSMVREVVPEFETRFRSVWEDEQRELETYQAVSEFARWLIERLHVDASSPEVQRAFEVVERLAVNRDAMKSGSALLTEFLEVVWGQPDVVERLGPVTSEYLNAW